MDTYARYTRLINTRPSVCVGKSLFGREIRAFFVGNPALRPVLIQSAIHAREWASAEACMRLFHYAEGRPLKGAYWFLPVTNPDGMLLSLRGINTAPKKYHPLLCSLNRGEDFSLWKANGRGVDLNVNFRAAFGNGKSNVFAPAPENYVGAYPESEPCTQALVRFTRARRPLLTVSLHTKGEEIYWHFPTGFAAFSGDKTLGKRLFSSLGYPLKKTKSSAGGYKDWCIQALKIPAYTVELFSDGLTHPVLREQADLLAPNLFPIIDQMEKLLWKNAKSI